MDIKRLQKIVSIALAAVIVLTAILLLNREEKDCCLCDSLRYHAPCLIDLETGDMIELDLYLPHETKVAQLAEEQPEAGGFSFIHFGNVSGTKRTDDKTIELELPAADKTLEPALCKKCRELLQADYVGRYVLADLYDTETKTLIPIADGTHMELRCYEITMTRNAETDGIAVTVQGTLER